jgi:hypothetical protein
VTNGWVDTARGEGHRAESTPGIRGSGRVGHDRADVGEELCHVDIDLDLGGLGAQLSFLQLVELETARDLGSDR